MTLIKPAWQSISTRATWHLQAHHVMQKHLGLRLDFTGMGSISAPEDRWTQWRQGVDHVLPRGSRASRVPVRTLACTTGRIISMGLALGDVTRLFTRAMYADIDSAPTWGSYVLLSIDTIEELQFWFTLETTAFTGRILPLRMLVTQFGLRVTRRTLRGEGFASTNPAPPGSWVLPTG